MAQKNHTGLILGSLAVLAAGGVGYYFYTKSQAPVGTAGLGAAYTPVGIKLPAAAPTLARGYSSAVYPHCPDACQVAAFALAQQAMHLTTLYGDDAMRTFQSMYSSARGPY